MPEEEELASTKVKIIIMGDTGIGKSCLATALVKGAAFTAGELAQSRHTVGAEHMSAYPEPSRIIEYQLLDLSGRDIYTDFEYLVHQDANIVLLTFDLTKASSFESLQYWLRRISHYIKHPDYHLILVGTKSDLVDQRQVSQEAIGHFCSQLQTQRQQEIPYIAVSAHGPEELQAHLFAAIQRFHPLPETASLSPSSAPTVSASPSIDDAPGSPLLRRRGSTGDLVGSYVPPTLFGPTSVLNDFCPKLRFGSSSSSSSSNTGPMTGSRVDLGAQRISSSSSASSDSYSSSSEPIPSMTLHTPGVNPTVRTDEDEPISESISISSNSRNSDPRDKEEIVQHTSPSSSPSSSSSPHQSTGVFTPRFERRDEEDDEESVEHPPSAAADDLEQKFTRGFRKIYTQLYDQSFFKDWRTETVQEVIKKRYELLSRKTMKQRAQDKPESRTAKTMAILAQLEIIKDSRRVSEDKQEIYRNFCSQFKSRYEGLSRVPYIINLWSHMKILVETLDCTNNMDFKTLTIDILCHAQLDPSSRTAKAVSVVLSRVLPFTVGDLQQEVMFQSPYSLDRTF